MTTLLGNAAPEIDLPGTSATQFRLSAKRGGPVVIYFYPKDDTPGCTTEAQAFRDLHGKFERCGCEIVGISRDPMRSHERFKAKFGLPFALLSDVDEQACTAYGVIRNKKMYGREVRGIERSTFLVDRDGVVQGEWRAVKVAGHVEEVLAAARSLPK